MNGVDMNYLITVSDGSINIERILFIYRDEALFFAEQRRKQGYTVTIKTIEIN